jgi:hypothetical protein
MEHMNCNKNIIRIFLTVYIFFFVIFPFSHCHADSELFEVNAAKEFSIENIHPLFTDPHCCEFHQKDRNSHNEHHVHFLAEGSNVSLRSTIIVKTAPQKLIAITEKSYHLVLKQSFAGTIQDEKQTPQQGFYAAHSGLSPPQN